jgi:hypothetical protein
MVVPLQATTIRVMAARETKATIESEIPLKQRFQEN